MARYKQGYLSPRRLEKSTVGIRKIYYLFAYTYREMQSLRLSLRLPGAVPETGRE